MAKAFKLEIINPCDETIHTMAKTKAGFFCNSCTKEVIDFSKLSNYEISKFISQNKNESICAQIKTTQLEEEFSLLEQAKINKSFKYAAVAASVLAFTGMQAQENTTTVKPNTQVEYNPHVVGKIAYVKPQNKIISITIEGNILDENTKKVLASKKFPNLQLYINGAKEYVKVNAKTGYFSIPITLDGNLQEINLHLSSNDFQLTKTIKINTKTIKNNVLKQTIFVNQEDFQKLMILGGLGVNYIDNNKLKNS